MKTPHGREKRKDKATEEQKTHATFGVVQLRFGRSNHPKDNCKLECVGNVLGELPPESQP